MKDYLNYIQKNSERGREKTRIKLFPNQAKKLREEYGFKVTSQGKPESKLKYHEKCWYEINCKNSIKGTKAWEMFGLVLAYRRNSVKR